MSTTPPTPPTDSTAIASAIVGLYVLGEQQILDGFTSIVRNASHTLAGAQGAVPKMRRLARQVLARLTSQSGALVTAMVNAAHTEGARDASASVGKALERLAAGSTGGGGIPPRSLSAGGGESFFDLSMPHGDRAAQAIRDDITSSLDDVRFRITRLPDDVYKMIAPHGAIYQALANGVTPAQAQAMAWRVFVSQGVTGFTDKSGRNWALSSYVEMAVRTAAMRAYNASHLARMHALGIHYFTVTDTGHPCPLCFPWQGKVLTDGVIQDPAMPVDATIAEAVAAGLSHPNCRHVLLPVIPGVTKLPAVQEWTPEMANDYNLTQKQRRLELAIRKAKREAQYALDPSVRKEATADVRAAQAKMREFIAATGSARQSRREQLNLSDAYIKLPTPIR